MERDEEIQAALDSGSARAAADADEAAYQVVFAALREDEGFALPPDFADAMAARLMPAPVRASPFERYVLPVLMLVACAMAVPTVIAALGGALTGVAGPMGESSGLHAIAAVALVAVVLGMADRLARRAGLAPM
ncbi:MAG TPA: hypothetical protein VGC13_09635 [Longimicrobium sp.]|jgi:hypothetical protein|uniref:hypothetical protein n=1 Tax=Longimicrobium sp. TaxID=2029185 RepID=UPI002ED8FA78